jgi:hypothetical protein
MNSAADSAEPGEIMARAKPVSTTNASGSHSAAVWEAAAEENFVWMTTCQITLAK